MKERPPGKPARRWSKLALFLGTLGFATLAFAPAALASEKGGGEASLVLPHLDQVSFHGISGQLLLTLGLIICVLGLLFGLTIFYGLRRLPVHKAMREISELIYQTCKTYLLQQG
ncbi:MAG: sodium-translocating pyrophosphatase, partial [Thermoleophilia bacterium]|nr:sodium-translocating pyrophosphatase [Thermoleophilia bacterium]